MEETTYDTEKLGKKEYEATEDCEAQLVSGAAYKKDGGYLTKDSWTKLKPGDKVADIEHFKIKLRSILRDQK
jgi:hypothetical protein